MTSWSTLVRIKCQANVAQEPDLPDSCVRLFDCKVHAKTDTVHRGYSRVLWMC